MSQESSGVIAYSDLLGQDDDDSQDEILLRHSPAKKKRRAPLRPSCEVLDEIAAASPFKKSTKFSRIDQD